MPEPDPTVRTLEAEQSKQPINSKITIGIIILIIGIALIIISSSLISSRRVSKGFLMTREEITDLRDEAKFGGVALLIVGGIIAAVKDDMEMLVDS
jgi:hypothetical protein